MLQHLKNDVALWRPDTWGCHHLWLRPPVVAMDPWIALIFVLQVLLGGKCPNSPGKIQSHCFMFTKKTKRNIPFASKMQEAAPARCDQPSKIPLLEARQQHHCSHLLKYMPWTSNSIFQRCPAPFFARCLFGAPSTLYPIRWTCQIKWFMPFPLVHLLQMMSSIIIAQQTVSQIKALSQSLPRCHHVHHK